MASIDSSAPETTSDSSPTLSRRPLRGGWAPTSWGRGQDSDSISSSSSDSLGSSSSSGSRRASASGGARAKTVEVGRSVEEILLSSGPPSESHPWCNPTIVPPATPLILLFSAYLDTHFRETPIPVPTPLPPQVQGPPSRESCPSCTQSAIRGSCTLLLRTGEDGADQGRGQQQHFHFHTSIFLRGPSGSSPQPAPLRLRDWALCPWPAQLCFSQLALTYLFFARFLDYR